MLEKVMDRKTIATTISQILKTGIELLDTPKLTQDDHAKIKVLRAMGTHINAAVAMVQQETAQLRAGIVVERMKQLGYQMPKELTE